MTTEPTAAALSSAERSLDAPTGREQRAASFSLRLALWAFGLMAATAALRDPMLTAPLLGGELPIGWVDQWFAIAIPAVGTLVAVAFLGLAASAMWLRCVTGSSRLGLFAAVGLGLEGTVRAAAVAGLSSGSLPLSLAVAGLGMIGWVALLLAMSQTVRRFGRPYPMGPMFWAVLLVVANFVHEVVDATGHPEIEHYPRFPRLGWIALTVTALVAAIAVARGRRAVLRAIAAVPASADAPAEAAVERWGSAPGWAFHTDGLRLIAAGLLVQVIATGLSIGLLFVTRAVHIELVFRTVVLTAPVIGGLSSLLMLAGAHGLTAGPPVASVRPLAWAAAGILIASLAGAGISYSTAILMLDDPLRAVEMTNRLSLWDAVLPIAGYVALYALLTVAQRVAEGFSERGPARRARGFRNLTFFTCVAALIYLLALRMNLGLTLLVLFGVLAVFMGVWLMLGSWLLLRNLADRVEANLVP